MLCFGNAPNQDVNLTRILRKITCNLLTNKRLRQPRYAQTTLDRIMVGDRHVIHPSLEQLSMQFFGIGIAVGKIEAAE